MSFLDDALGGLFSGSDDAPSISDALLQGGGGSNGPDNADFAAQPSGANYGTGLLQSLTTLGTGYISKRLDVDLQQRIAGNQPIPGLRTTQNGIGGYGQVVRTPQGGTVAAVNLSAVMPLILVAAVAFFLAKR